MTSRWGIAANVYGDRIFREGARVWVLVLPGDNENVWVEGRSIGGRIIRKWVRSHKLSGFRAKFCPSKDVVFSFDDKDTAQNWAEEYAAHIEAEKDERQRRQTRRLAMEAIQP